MNSLISSTHRESISMRSLRELRECEHTLKYGELGLGSSGMERVFFMRRAIDFLKKELLEKPSLEELLSKVQNLFDTEYLQEWFALPIQYEAGKQKDLFKLERFLRYFYEKEGEVFAIDVPYRIPLQIDVKGFQFDTVTGKADILFQDKEGRVEAILIENKKCPYSYGARKQSNKAENALELLTMFLGISSMYPNVDVSCYYLKHKDDKGGALAPVFENKKGKNIITLDHTKLEKQAVQSKLQEVLESTDSSRKCDDCRYNDICNIAKDLRMNKDVKEVGPLIKADYAIKYTKAQRKVVEHQNGPMRVIAVPGAGKTFSLVQRLLYLIKEKGVLPSHILFVTFTNRAAEEIKERVMKALDTQDEKKLPNILTFNGFGYQLLKDNPSLVGYRVKLASSVDRLVIIKEVLSSVPRIQGVSYDGLYTNYGLIRSLDKWFQSLDEEGEEAFRERYEGKKDVEGILVAYKEYKRQFKSRGLITYDDQIRLVNELFEKRPRLAKLYSKKYQYIMVDEFQDVSEENVRMIYSIAKFHGNIVVVGDDDQAIYTFRGGSNQFMLEFDQEFPDTKTIVMNDNFRSTNTILLAANELIQKNKDRFDKEIVPHSENPYKPIWFKSYNIESLVGLIGSILKKGYKLGDIAIIARNNKTLFKIADTLKPYYSTLSPKDYIRDDMVFNCILDVLTLYYKGLEQDKELYRFFCYQGKEESLYKANKKVSLIENIITTRGYPEILMDNEESLEFYMKECDDPIITTLAKIFKSFQIIKDEKKGIIHLLDNLCISLFALENHPVIDILKNMADERAILDPYNLYQLMSDMKLFQDETRVGYDTCEGSINLLTAHDSKGKEFPLVIVFGAEDFNAESEEEVRLFYVAITRAKKTLFVTESEFSKGSLLNDCSESFQVHF